MSRKVKFPFFYVGKNKPKTDKRQSCFEGEANSNMDKYDKRNGKFVSRRKFDKDGKAYVDLDAADKKHKNDHAHDIDVKKVPPRSEGRENLSKKERRELNKAKKKRRLW